MLLPCFSFLHDVRVSPSCWSRCESCWVKKLPKLRACRSSSGCALQIRSVVAVWSVHVRGRAGILSSDVYVNPHNVNADTVV